MTEYFLPEDRGHLVSYSEHGNPAGPPILSFHGGPGSKSKPSQAERFDLSKYRVILFDQRGCGKSTPRGAIEHNTTQDILLDAERIREQLGIGSWFVSGSSWGATCALLYALAHPERVRGLLLSSVFLADRDSAHWAMTDPNGAARLMPDVWARRMEFFKEFGIRLESQHADILKALEQGSLEDRKKIVAGVFNWEGNLVSAQSAVSFVNPADLREDDIAPVRIFSHFEAHHAFIPDNHILDQLAALAHLPAVIVHGRYDILCPVAKAHQLHEKMQNSELIIATSSGHQLTAEGEMIRRLAFDRFLGKAAAL